MSLGERFDECPFEKNADQVALVLGAAFEVVDGIDRLRQGFRRSAELSLNLRLGAGEQAVFFGGLSRNHADAADNSSRFLDILAVDVEDQREPQRRPFF